MKIWKSLILATILIGLICAAPVGAASKTELKIAQWEDINTLDPGWLTSQDRELTVMRCIYNNLVKFEEGSWDDPRRDCHFIFMSHCLQQMDNPAETLKGLLKRYFHR